MPGPGTETPSAWVPGPCRGPPGMCAQHAALRLPHRFADFVGGASHVTPDEVSVHEREYGLGGIFFEDQLFEEEDEDDSFERNHANYSLTHNYLDAD